MTTEQREQDDPTKAAILGAMTHGRPYALISMDPVEDDNKIVVMMDCGGGITNQADLEEFLEAALRYLREG